MKKRLSRSFVVVMAILTGNTLQADEVMKVDSAHEHVAYSQKVVESGSGVQSRYRGESDVRSVCQTFEWNKNAPLTGIGIMVSDEPAGSFKNSQKYKLYIHELISLSSRVVYKNMGTASFTLTPEIVERGKYFYVKLDTPLKLSKGKGYGFQLVPEQNVDNRLSIAWSGPGKGDKAYPTGIGSQIATKAEIAVDEQYQGTPKDRSFDLVFYFTSGEEYE